MTPERSLADLELSLARQGTSYTLSLWLRRPGDLADLQRGPFPVTLDSGRLLAANLDAKAYSHVLSEAIFGAPQAAAAFTEARAAALSHGRLRVRLLIPAELQGYRWETLRDPASGRHLATEGDLLLSRYVTADDFQAVTPRPAHALTALVAVAAPADAQSYGLAALDAGGEVARAQAALNPLAAHTLGAPGGPPATLAALAEALLAGCDILYLLAHGALVDEQPFLYLVGAEGRATTVAGERLAQIVRSLGERRPRLALLGSCQSAGGDNQAALAALGPALVRAGVPAVVAMQGAISVASATQFLGALCADLLRDGWVERAVAVARLAIVDRPDWWAPVLYSRLRNGRLWEGSPRGLQLTAQPAKAGPVDRRALRVAMIDAFTLDDLALLCDNIEQDLRAAGFELQVNLEMIGGSTRSAKVLELIGYLERRGYLGYLVDAVRRERPGLI